MNPVLLTWALLGPPAIFGIAVALESWTHHLQQWRRAHRATVAELERHRLEARHRHPAYGPDRPRTPLEDSPEWPAVAP